MGCILMATVVNKYWLKADLGGSYDAAGAEQSQSVIVTYDEVVTNILDAVRYSGFRQGQRHPNKGTLFISGSINADVHDEDNAKVWVFDLTYTTRPLDDNQAQDDADYRPEIKPGKWTYQVVVDRDKETGDALVNPAGDPYDPLPIDNVSSPLFNITIKEYSSHITRIPLVGSINSAAFTLCGVQVPAYCAMFDDYDPQPYYDDEGNLTFRNRFTIKLKFFRNKAGKQIGFKRETLQAGFNQLIAGDKVEIRVKDPDDPTNVEKEQPVATPQMLDSSGAVTETPYYVENVTYDLIDFGQFNLPTSYPVI
jgi:hypothetical protein